MAKFTKKPKDTDHQEEGHEEDGALGTSPKTDLKDATPDVREIEIRGTRYRIGASVTLNDQEATVVDERALKASAHAGVSEGTYPIVSVVLKPGNRTAYRAVVGDTLYPIRGHGTAGEVIAKNRDPAKESTKRRGRAAAVITDERVELALSVQAAKILDSYLYLKAGTVQWEVLSALVVDHLGPEVERMERAREAIQKLPTDLLSALAEASDEKRQKILEMLR